MQIPGLFPQWLGHVRLILFSLVLMVTLPSFQPVVHAQEHSMHEMHAGMAMPMDDSADPVRHARLLADKRESEFNHHLAGFFVLLAGMLLLAEGSIRERWPLFRLFWPVCFLLSGFFVLVWSDTELWPFGPQSWYYGLTHHLEVLQHKTFAVLLLALGVIEIQRARGVLKTAWSSWVFPVLAVIGSSMLFFHDHRAGMHGPNPMELMHRIQSEHFSFAMAGFGIGLSKGLAETRFPWRAFFEKLFPALLMVLGALLMVYVE
jgi:copper resistance protein D